MNLICWNLRKSKMTSNRWVEMKKNQTIIASFMQSCLRWRFKMKIEENENFKWKTVNKIASFVLQINLFLKFAFAISARDLYDWDVPCHYVKLDGVNQETHHLAPGWDDWRCYWDVVLTSFANARLCIPESDCQISNFRWLSVQG